MTSNIWLKKKYIQTKKIPKILLTGVLIFIAVSGHIWEWRKGRGKDGDGYVCR